MKDNMIQLSLPVPTSDNTSPGLLTNLFREAMLKRLAKLEYGSISLLENGVLTRYGNPNDPMKATVEVHHPRFYQSLGLGGSTGAGEAYMQGFWSTSDLVTLFRIMLGNRHVLESMDGATAWLGRFKDKLYDITRENTLKGSKKNIVAHYDLSNEFYSLFLDPTMTYSSGIFPTKTATMEEASVEKLDRLCRKLDLNPGDHVLEIGTGWGSFAIHAASRYGVKVTTTTISDRQYALAKERIAEAGLEDRITLLNQDYRTLKGEYDFIVSIEMIEAVGHKFIPEFVSTLNRLLKHGGQIALQGITINDQQYDSYKDSVDFIKRYIFPGGNLLSLSYFADTLKKESTLRMTGLEEIGLHYAETLKRWRETFDANLDKIRKLGFSDSFIRMWEFYLTYCEAGFREKHIGTAQLVLEKL